MGCSDSGKSAVIDIESQSAQLISARAFSVYGKQPVQNVVVLKQGHLNDFLFRVVEFLDIIVKLIAALRRAEFFVRSAVKGLVAIQTAASFSVISFLIIHL